jgi:AraC family transcriptional regulator
MEHFETLDSGEYSGRTMTEARGESLLASMIEYESGICNVAEHAHVHPHLSFVLKGWCSEKKTSTYERLPGTSTFYFSDEPHQVLAMRKSTHLNLEFEEEFFRRHGLSEEDFQRIIFKTPDAKFLMLRALAELSANDQFTIASIEMLLLGFLEKAKCWRDGRHMPGWIQCAHDLLHDRWDENPSLEDLSEATGIHPSTISRFFPKYFSCTLGAYMRKLKIERALTLIKFSDASLTGIAYQCGFFDQSHFIRTFKEVTGMSPGEYRRL